MIEAFIWMFKTPGFKQLFVKLYLMYCGLTLLAIFTSVVNLFKLFGINFLYGEILSVVFILSANLILSGCFWYLTKNVIDRTFDIKSASIYNGKTKKFFIIELPEFGFFRFLWRGIASTVANLLLIMPYILLFYVTFSAGLITSSMLPSATTTLENATLAAYAVIFLILVLLLPGLLWNYAKQNSVFAVWNVFKAFYLFDYYPLRYIFKSICFAFVYILEYSLFSALYIALKPNPDSSFGIIMLVAYVIVHCIICVYFSYVLAYLLGTLAPEEEN